MSLKRTSTPTIPFAASGLISGGGGGHPALAAAPDVDLDVSVIPPSEPSSISGSISDSGTTGNLSTSGNLSNSGGGQRRMEQDDGARDMMAALEEVVRLRGEKEAKVASLKAEAEELRARTAAEAGRRDRAKLKAAEILAPVPALRQGIWAQSDLLKRLRNEVHDLGGPLAEAKSRLEVARLKRNWAEEDAERCSSRVREFLGKAESVGSVESETLEGLRARLREKTDALDDLTVATGGGEEKLEVVLRRTQYRLEVAENANAAMLARSQGQGAALEAGRRRLTKLEQEVRMMKSKNQAELRRKQRKLESQRGKSGDD